MTLPPLKQRRELSLLFFRHGIDAKPAQHGDRLLHLTHVGPASGTAGNVELESGAQKYQTRTDDAGVYQFENLPAGEYTLTITAGSIGSVRANVTLSGSAPR